MYAEKKAEVVKECQQKGFRSRDGWRWSERCAGACAGYIGMPWDRTDVAMEAGRHHAGLKGVARILRAPSSASQSAQHPRNLILPLSSITQSAVPLACGCAVFLTSDCLLNPDDAAACDEFQLRLRDATPHEAANDETMNRCCRLFSPTRLSILQFPPS